MSIYLKTSVHLNPLRIQRYPLNGRANFSYRIENGKSKTFEHFHGLIFTYFLAKGGKKQSRIFCTDKTTKSSEAEE